MWASAERSAEGRGGVNILCVRKEGAGEGGKWVVAGGRGRLGNALWGGCGGGWRLDRQSPFVWQAGPLKVAAESFQTPLKGIMAADCEASKGRKRGDD